MFKYRSINIYCKLMPATIHRPLLWIMIVKTRFGSCPNLPSGFIIDVGTSYQMKMQIHCIKREQMLGPWD